MMHQSARSLGVRTDDPTPLLEFLLPVFAWAPLTYPGYFVFRSGFLPVFNQADLLVHLGDLSWAPTVGVAYDLLRGERSLPYLLGGLPAALGSNPADATKWVFALSLLAASVGMFGWARHRLGNWSALVAAMAYIYSPVTLVTIYGRGAYGEAVLFGLLPLLLCSADTVLAGKKLAAIVLLAGVAAAMLTQTGLALWFLAGLLAYVLAAAGHGAIPAGRGAPTALVVLGGSLLGVLGLLPAFFGKGFGGAVTGDFFERFMGLHEVLGAPELTMAPGLGLGLMAVGLAIFAFLLPSPSISQPETSEMGRGGEVRFTRNYALAMVVILVFLSTNLSVPLWRVLPFLAKTVTYPWQLLLLAGPWLAWLAGLGASRLQALLPESHQEAVAVPLLAGILVLTLLGVYSDLRPVTTAEPVGRAPIATYGDNEIALLSVATEGAPGPGGRVALEVHWQALRPLTHDYTVFFHVVALSGNGQRYAQYDGMPQGGRLPTTRWLPGEIIMDRYEVVVAPDAPIGGEYRYWLGWYLGESGKRLPVGEDDKFVVAP